MVRRFSCTRRRGCGRLAVRCRLLYELPPAEKSDRLRTKATVDSDRKTYDIRPLDWCRAFKSHRYFPSGWVAFYHRLIPYIVFAVSRSRSICAANGSGARQLPFWTDAAVLNRRSRFNPHGKFFKVQIALAVASNWSAGALVSALIKIDNAHGISETPLFQF